MIKIGILAMQREYEIDFLIESIREYTVNPYQLLIACDSQELYDHCVKKGYPCIGGGERIGIARNKNRLFKWFIDEPCNHFFKFDDDCYPIKKGWDNWIIDGHNETGYPYFVFASENHEYGYTRIVLEYKNYSVKICELDGNMLLSMKPEVFEKIGGMNLKFGGYGGEDSEYGQRVRRARIIPNRAISLVDMDKYIWSPHIDEYLKLGPRGATTDWVGKQKEAEFGVKLFMEIGNLDPIYQSI